MTNNFLTPKINLSQLQVLNPPELPKIQKGFKFIEQFDRETLLPTNWPELYGIGADGTGSVSITTNRRLDMLPQNGAFYTTFRAKKVFSNAVQSKSIMENLSIKYKITFQPLNNVGNRAMFIGVLEHSTDELAAFPTENGVGLIYDTAVDTNFQLANIVSTVVDRQDTGDLPVVNDTYMLEIDYQLTNKQVLKLFKGNNQEDLVFEHTFTDTLGNHNKLQIWNQALAGNRGLRIFEWSVEAY